MKSASTARHLPYTWDDYRTWPDDERWEIVNGEAYAMSPAPSVRHQHIHRELFTAVCVHFRGRACRVYSCPIDVKLSGIQTQRLKSFTFPELEIELTPVFDFPLETGEEWPVVREPPGRYAVATPMPGNQASG